MLKHMPFDLAKLVTSDSLLIPDRRFSSPWPITLPGLLASQCLQVPHEMIPQHLFVGSRMGRHDRTNRRLVSRIHKRAAESAMQIGRAHV